MKKLLILLCTIFVLTSCSSNESKASEIIEKYEGMTFISETEVPEKIKETSLVSQDHMRFSIIKIGPNEKIHETTFYGVYSNEEIYTFDYYANSDGVYTNEFDTSNKYDDYNKIDNSNAFYLASDLTNNKMLHGFDYVYWFTGEEDKVELHLSEIHNLLSDIRQMEAYPAIEITDKLSKINFEMQESDISYKPLDDTESYEVLIEKLLNAKVKEN
ncbi:hypothetical protein ERUR111494_06865 [Erysipelothrix urinaevulpis]|uniref:hypothetical protein n=1 Tax=Erysipelothrix urinaevulpis TaxID=2683717 RepID=UPI00135B2CAF|nr:hypothetical protein [Erysipelothrix urinaevulpis]